MNAPTNWRSALPPLMKLAGVIGFAAGLVSCGLVGIGSGSGSDESAPQGTILRTGTFSSFGGHAVEGLVEVIVTSGGGINVLRLESFSSPSVAGLQLRATVNGTDTFIGNLKSYSGNSNYYSSLSGSSNSWTSVSIYSTSEDEVYATAVFDQ